jgi:hypothetical protein
VVQQVTQSRGRFCGARVRNGRQVDLPQQSIVQIGQPQIEKERRSWIAQREQ